MPRHSRDLKLEQFWRRHLAQQPASGLTVGEYCRKHALREPSFYAWRRIMSQRDQVIHPAPDPTPSPEPAFLPVAIVDSKPRRDTTPIDIRLANGSRIRVRSGCDRSLLADVLAILHTPTTTEARPC